MSRLIQPMEERYSAYLKDESRTTGDAESISFPRNESDIGQLLKTLFRQRTPITVQGSRTGITGAAVPKGGHIMNLSAMTNVMGIVEEDDATFSIRVQPGLCLSDLDRLLASAGTAFETGRWEAPSLKAFEAFRKAGRLFWPPDPTEGSASIGGIAANNARGICAYHYGPASRHIRAIRVVDAKGEVHNIHRGDYYLSQGALPLPGGGHLEIHPDNIAFDLGEHSLELGKQSLDLVDLYLGSEGMLGIITELTLALQPMPDELWGIVFFFKDPQEAAGFIEAVNDRQSILSNGNLPDTDFSATSTRVAAIEYLDQTTLECIEKLKQTNSRLKPLPNIDPGLTTAVYLEIHANHTNLVHNINCTQRECNFQQTEELLEWLMETATAFESDSDTTWAFSGEVDIERIRLFRRAAPESINAFIDAARRSHPEIRKLGTDMKLPNIPLSALLEMYQAGLKRKKLRAAVFGHAGDRHLHVNILPEDAAQYMAGRELVEEWAFTVNAQGGSVVTEHGIGKTRKHLFRKVPLPKLKQLIAMAKQQLDLEGLLNPGNML